MTSTIRRMRFETWVREFEPVRNHFIDNTAMEGIVFLDSGDSGEFVRAQNPNHVWSFIVYDGVRNAQWSVTNGMRRVNVMGYVLTTRPASTNLEYEINY